MPIIVNSAPEYKSTKGMGGEEMNRKIIVVWVVTLVFSFSAGYYFSHFYEGDKRDTGFITFTFDDNRMGQYTYAKGILEAAGFRATFFVTRDNFDKDPSFFGADEVKALYEAGHEIGDHTKTHRDLTKLSEAEIRWEIDADHLKALGIKPRSHAYPYGSYNKTVIQLVSQFYDYARAAGKGTAMSLESPPINTYSLNGRAVERDTPIATVKGWIDEAVTSRKWLILVFHNIVESPSVFTEHSVSGFQEIVAYIKTKGITVKTLSEVSDLLTFRPSAICPSLIDDFNRVQTMSHLAELGNHLMGFKKPANEHFN